MPLGDLLSERQADMPAGDSQPRQDGGLKGRGFLGPLKRKDGRISTELSINIEIDGREIDMPLLVPTLDENEIRLLLDNDIDPKKLPKSIMDKATAHAMERIERGESPFFD